MILSIKIYTIQYNNDMTLVWPGSEREALDDFRNGIKLILRCLIKKINKKRLESLVIINYIYL